MLLLQVQIQLGVLLDKCFPCTSRKVEYKNGILKAITIPKKEYASKKVNYKVLPNQVIIVSPLSSNDTTDVNLK